MFNQVISLGLPKSHFFLKLSNKMRCRKNKNIFGFNHIDPRIQEEELEEIKKRFRFLRKIWSGSRRNFISLNKNEQEKTCEEKNHF